MTFFCQWQSHQFALFVVKRFLVFDKSVPKRQFTIDHFNYATKKALGTDAAADLAAYMDADKISAWALDAMKWANAEGLINGRSEDSLAPDGTATRAEAATILMRFIEEFMK